MTLYEDSLSALAHLLHRVCAQKWEADIRSDIEAWRERRDARQHRNKYGGHSTYGDWVIHSQNGHRVDEIQQVWANELLFCLQGILQQLSEKPDDPRRERKIVNGLNRQRSILRDPPSKRTPSKLKAIGSDRYLRVIRCEQCGNRYATHLSIDSVIAGDLVRDYLCDAYASGTMIEWVDSSLDSTIDDLTRIRAGVTEAAERAGIAIVENGVSRNRCATCGGEDVTVSNWSLIKNGQLRFELAEFERQKQDVAVTASPAYRSESELAAPVSDQSGYESGTVTTRLWGAAVAVVAFVILIAEFRYLISHQVPAATGSLRGNWGLLLLLGLPLVVLVGGTLQALSGIHIRDYFSVFAAQTITKKIVVSVTALTVAIAAVGLAAIIG